MLCTSLPYPSEFSILSDLMFDSSLDWGAVPPLDIGESILKMCRENEIALPDLSRKRRELCEREKYWATGPNGQGGITESFAKRLFEFMKTEEGKFLFIFLTLQISSGGESVLSWSLKWKDGGAFYCGRKYCKFSAAEFFFLI